MHPSALLRTEIPARPVFSNLGRQQGRRIHDGGIVSKDLLVAAFIGRATNTHHHDHALLNGTFVMIQAPT